jgi:hypothetical protein
MKSTYSSKADHLETLLTKVLDFFQSRGLFVSTKRNDFTTTVSVQTNKSGPRILDVCLENKPDHSLSVIFAAADDSPMTNSTLLSMLGGGFLTLRKLKTAENLERLENEFWDMVDLHIAAY